MTAQPERDTSPFSISERLPSPISPSSVRQVPLRFRGSGLPGYHVVLPVWFLTTTDRFADEAGTVRGSEPLRYFSSRAEVVI